jgi:diguanylate cyclase (GGDEF)-like protein
MREVAVRAGDHTEREAIERAVRGTAWSGIQAVCLGLVGLYGLFAVSHLALLPDGIRTSMAIVAGATSIALLATWTVITRVDGLVRFAFPIAFGIVSLAWFNSWIHLHLSGDILESTNLILVLIGASFFIPSARWFGGAGALVIVSWAVTSSTMRDQDAYGHFVFAMVSALVLAGLIQWVRTRSLNETQQLRLISEAQRKELELLATHDFLTGLANRRLFLERLELAMADSKRTKGRLGLLFLDLDGFKSLNDTFGHAFGDEVLKAAADRLGEAIRETDLAARLGGDEFGVLLTHVHTTVDLDIASERIRMAFAGITFPGKDVVVEASIGTAIYPDDGETVEAFFDAADTEMYRMKRERQAATEAYEKPNTSGTTTTTANAHPE